MTLLMAAQFNATRKTL